MEVHEALYTCRAMRRVRPDPVPLDVQARILDAAIRAPTGGNAQTWHFLLVDDPAVKGELGPLYRDAMDQLWTTVYAPRIEAAAADPDHPESQQFERVRRSAQHLADHFEAVPLYLFGFAQYDPSGGSIYPAVWSAELAARAEGVGSALTVVLSVFHGPEAYAILGVPPDEGWLMACCVSFGYPEGRWAVAPRRLVHEVSSRTAGARRSASKYRCRCGTGGNRARPEVVLDSMTVHAEWNGVVLADSDKTVVVEGNHYFPLDSVDLSHFKETATHTICPWKGEASYYDVTANGETNADAAWFYPAPLDAAKEIKDHVAFWKGVSVTES